MSLSERLEALPSVQLISLCCDEENSDAWDEFIKRFHKQLSLFVFRETRAFKFKDSEVCELLQDLYLKLLSNDRKILKDFRGNTEGSVLAYLLTVVRSVVTDQIRKEIAQKRYAPEISLNAPLKEDQELTIADLIKAGQESSPDHIVNEKITIKHLRELLKEALSGSNAKRDSIIFHLHIINGLSCREIAELSTFSMTTANVQAVVFRTKERLRERLGKKNPDGF
jgi:RNA polymerase sigma factor (sigma-70 family)